ncbi:MAG TPA: LPS assembly protein LptD [Alphaproteobacteria bacterium]|nr:LPS assembly protein LptD [Alphaproteobacteria bacterium]
MPHRISRALLLATCLGLSTMALAPAAMAAPAVPRGTPVVAPESVDKSDKNVVLSADNVSKDDVNNTVSANGHVELVQGATMLLAEHVVWNQNTDIVIATGDVKLVDNTGNIFFGDYLEVTDDMRQAFMRNVSGLLSDNSRLVARQSDKDGNVTVLNRGIYSPCELCKDDPTQAPTWQIKAEKVIHDTDTKRLYYHNATFQIDGVPVLWTPYFSSYDPSVKRASGILDILPGYRSQLGTYIKSSYYFDIAPDMDAVLDTAYYSRQGPSLGGEFRERFDTGQIQISGSIAESDIHQNPEPSPFDTYKTVRYHVFGSGEFDLDDHWRTGFEFARSLDDIYVLKYEYSSLQVLPSKAYVEGFYDRDYINASVYSFQDLRALNDLGLAAGTVIPQQPTALPYVTYSFYGNPGEFLGGRWADSGSLLAIQRFPSGQNIERLANNVSWERKLTGDSGLVTTLNASLETDYYWTQNATADPFTNVVSAERSTGRAFPQAYAVMSYPVERPVGYANWVVEPIMSVVAAPNNGNNTAIPNEDSNDIQIDAANLFSGNRFPGIDRIEDGSRVTYGVRTGLYNLGTGYTTLFLGQSYRITGNTVYPLDSGLQTRFSDFVGEIEIVPGRLFDVDWRFELANDLKTDRLQEVNFRIGPDNYGIFGTYLFAGQVSIPTISSTLIGPGLTGTTLTIDGVPINPNLAASERNELSMAAYYKFDKNWQITAGETAELTHPRAILRYSVSAGYTDDCSSFTLNLSHDQTLLVGGTSGTAVSLVFTLKNLGIFTTPSIH